MPGVERNVRGFSAASLVLVDEASQAPNELYRVMRPMLGSSKGDIWLMSTPFGKRGFFFEAWSDEKQAWTRVMSPATECPRFTAEFLEEERYVQGDAYFRQEYMCEFIDDDDSVFTYEELMKVVYKGNSAYKL